MTAISLTNWSDKLERLAATGAQAFLSVIILTDCSTLKTAAVAAGAAILALVKSWAREVLDRRAA